MVRVKRGTIAHKRKKNLLENTKGFKWGRKSKYTLAKQAMQKAWTYAYRDRKKNKSNRRALWQININSAVRHFDISYSKFIAGLKKNKIELDRKVLAQLASENPEVFEKIVEKAKS